MVGYQCANCGSYRIGTNGRCLNCDYSPTFQTCGTSIPSVNYLQEITYEHYLNAATQEEKDKIAKGFWDCLQGTGQINIDFLKKIAELEDGIAQFKENKLNAIKCLDKLYGDFENINMNIEIIDNDFIIHAAPWQKQVKKIIEQLKKGE